MAGFICPECSKDVSAQDVKCPHCGEVIPALSGDSGKIPWDDGSSSNEIPEGERTKDYVEWREEYNIGIPDIDKQHKSIVSLINEIYHSMHQTNRKGDYVLEVLEKLDNYVVEHFSYEEKLFKAAKYPGYQEHRKQHQVFAENIKELHEEFGSSFVNLRLLMQFLTGWLVEHIGESDRNFAIFWHDKMKEISSSDN